MAISTSVRLGVAALAIAAAALPAIGQDRPESLLPPGFGDTAPTPSPRPSGNPPADLLPGSPATVQPLPGDGASPSATPSATPTPDAKALAEYELPSSARRSLGRIGVIGPAEDGLAPDAFGDANGVFLETLMRRLDAPLPSRWMSIVLRRALASRVDTPRGVGGADFAAERAWLLLRMGESVTARAVVQGVDNDRATQKLLQVAMNTALANGDPGELCPLVGRGLSTPERGWRAAQVMCTALAGDARGAKVQLAAARRRGLLRGIDLRLVEKVAGAAPGGGQAVTIEWSPGDALTAWRYGLATATGVAIPDDAFATTGRQVVYWHALSPQVPTAQRVTAAEAAAGQGVLSHAALVDLYGALADDDDAPASAGAAAADLRTGYVGGDAAARANAIASLWGERPAYARLVLTAGAAARLPVGTAVERAPLLVASMLTAGFDRAAARWRPAVPAGGDAWAMIALADPDRDRVSYADLSGYAGAGDAALKQRLLFAGLAGLGRLSAEDRQRAAEALQVPLGAANGWTRALDRAVAARQPGTVVLLCAIGMQTPGWRGVAPATLYRIVAALRAVGLEGEARMIAAEAIART